MRIPYSNSRSMGAAFVKSTATPKHMTNTRLRQWRNQLHSKINILLINEQTMTKHFTRFPLLQHRTVTFECLNNFYENIKLNSNTPYLNFSERHMQSLTFSDITCLQQVTLMRSQETYTTKFYALIRRWDVYP